MELKFVSRALQLLSAIKNKKVKSNFLILIFVSFGFTLRAQVVSDTVYEGRSHFLITTATATYYFDKAGGGISRMIDKDGNDWIAFKMEPWDKVPGSAASAFRGIPNAVFRGEDGGCGHPGFDKCLSTLNGKNTIHTRSKSGKWEWKWTFYNDCAVWEVLKADSTRKYWFLYEGPVGGTFEPSRSFWGYEAKKILYDTPNHMGGERISGNWQTVYFGKKGGQYMLQIEHLTPDEQEDHFSYMGNTSDGIHSPDGMLVFGFGRDASSQPLLTGKHKFRIRFIVHGEN